MGMLTTWNAVTLEGCFEGRAERDLPGLASLRGEGLEPFSREQVSRAAALVFGRVSYEGMADYWSKAAGAIAGYMNALPTTALSESSS